MVNNSEELLLPPSNKLTFLCPFYARKPAPLGSQLQKKVKVSSSYGYCEWLGQGDLRKEFKQALQWPGISWPTFHG